MPSPLQPYLCSSGFCLSASSGNLALEASSTTPTGSWSSSSSCSTQCPWSSSCLPSPLSSGAVSSYNYFNLTESLVLISFMLKFQYLTLSVCIPSTTSLLFSNFSQHCSVDRHAGSPDLLHRSDEHNWWVCLQHPLNSVQSCSRDHPQHQFQVSLGCLIQALLSLEPDGFFIPWCSYCAAIFVRNGGRSEIELD